LLSYAVFGRTAAYIGITPLYVGEVFLAWGLLRAPIFGSLGKLLTNIVFLLFTVFLVVCAVRLLMSSSIYPIGDRLRDGAIWGYGLFAVIIAAYCLRTPQVIAHALRSYSHFSAFYILIGPVMALLATYANGRLPRLPGLQVTLLEQKPGDVQVHLAAILAFTYLGFRRFTLVQYAILVCGLLMLGSINRGGFLAFMCATMVLFIMKPRYKIIAVTLASVGLAVTLLSFVDFETRAFGRDISSEQIKENLLSIVGEGGSGDLVSTRQWRLDWWNDIINYTVHGDYFWTGKGFGINLANSDGYQVDVDGDSLRSPHNSHMTFLARGGVPIFALWIVLQLSWCFGMLRVVLRARAARDEFWENVAIFLLTYWVAMIVNMNFDVYLEGPMGGIWFWTIWGYGLAIMWLYRYRPQSLAQGTSSNDRPSSMLVPHAAE
jgi:hypothetical protein